MSIKIPAPDNSDKTPVQHNTGDPVVFIGPCLNMSGTTATNYDGPVKASQKGGPAPEMPAASGTKQFPDQTPKVKLNGGKS